MKFVWTSFSLLLNDADKTFEILGHNSMIVDNHQIKLRKIIHFLKESYNLY